MNQLSLFEQDEIKLGIYEVFDLHDLHFEIEKYVLIKIYQDNSHFCYAKTTCGKLVHMFVSKINSNHHYILMVYENLRNDYIERHLSKVETKYAEGVKA